MNTYGRSLTLVINTETELVNDHQVLDSNSSPLIWARLDKANTSLSLSGL